MAGLPWIELDTDMPEHPKALRMAVMLKEPLAFAYVVRLFCYCGRSNVEGLFEGTEAADTIEAVVGWKGKPGRFVEAALAVGHLDRTPHGFEVHGWLDRAGPHVAKRARDAERMRNRRAKASEGIGKVVPMSRGRSGDVDATS
jgi:hypothetical protein